MKKNKAQKRDRGSCCFLRVVRDIPPKVTLRDLKEMWESGKSVPSRGNSKGPEVGAFVVCLRSGEWWDQEISGQEAQVSHV